MLLDASVLENYHAAETFKIINHDDYNVLSLFKNEEYRIVRRRMIEGILATDMSYHAKHLIQLKSKLDAFEIKKGENIEKLISGDDIGKIFENQQSVLSMCLHTADISNPAKPDVVYDKWVDLVFEEFFAQGDCEREEGLEISYLCDRNTVDREQAQVGFISFVVLPCFDLVARILPEISEYIDNIKMNLDRYKKKVDEKKALKS